ncbi:hypothetical protein IAT38_007083 [Cryptococcus sp. DSM 104549]
MNSPTSSAHHPPPAMTKQPNRRSWFSFTRSKPNSPRAEEASLAFLHPPDPASTTGLPSLPGAPPSSYGPIPEDRLSPIQFSPNRIATLYVTPSERSLYLAAMAQLDAGPPPLPLWTDPAPSLPSVRHAPPLQPVDVPRVPSVHYRGFSDPTSGATTPAHHPWSARAMSPKLWPAPDTLPSPTGLQVRDEFRTFSPPRPSAHAILALSPPGTMRFTGLPVSVLILLDEVLDGAAGWPRGVARRSERVEELKAKGDAEADEVVWTVELEGKVWKRKGSEEIDIIRLLLEVFKTLGIHGWTLVETVQATGNKKDTHELLFSYSPMTSLHPPAFFALSIPLPDRLSLINPPLKATPALIEALRSAIISASPLKSSTRGSGSGSPRHSNPAAQGNEGEAEHAPRITWKGYDPRGIKLEGWVHEGVYRFWIDGMRRWLGGVIKRQVVENLHPHLVIALINNISALHFELAGSVPLLPFTRGRDVLIFGSLPPSGLTAGDSYVVPRGVAATAPDSSGDRALGGTGRVASSQDLASERAAQPAPVGVRQVPGQRGQTQGQARDPHTGDGARNIPWTSLLEGAPPTQPNQTNQSAGAQSLHPPPRAHKPPPSASRHAFPTTNAPESADPPASGGGLGGFLARRRTRSNDSQSAKPTAAEGGSAGSTTRQPNKLLKKNSLKRRSAQSLAAAAGVAGAAAGTTTGHRQASDASTLPPTSYREAGHPHLVLMNATKDDRDGWSIVDPPVHDGQSGRTTSANGGGSGRVSPVRMSAEGQQAYLAGQYERAQAQGKVAQESPRRGGGEPRNSEDSGESVYVDAPAALAFPVTQGGSPQRGGLATRGKAVDEVHGSPRPSLDNIPIPSSGLDYTSSAHSQPASHSAGGLGLGLVGNRAFGNANGDAASSIITHPLALGQPMPTPPDEDVVGPVPHPASTAGGTYASSPRYPATTIPAPGSPMTAYSHVPAPVIVTVKSTTSGSPRRARTDIVDTGVESMVGSVGWAGSVMSRDSRVPAVGGSSVGGGRGSVDGGLVDGEGYAGSRQFHGIGGPPAAASTGAAGPATTARARAPGPAVEPLRLPTAWTIGRPESAAAQGTTPSPTRIPVPLLDQSNQPVARQGTPSPPQSQPRSSSDEGQEKDKRDSPKRYMLWDRKDKGKGKEGMRKVWDEDKGVWVEVPVGREGWGSARTRVNIG